jgi:hypothetical protein
VQHDGSRSDGLFKCAFRIPGPSAWRQIAFRTGGRDLSCPALLRACSALGRLDESRTCDFRLLKEPSMRRKPDNDPPSDGADGFTLRDEADAIVAVAFRNGLIENLHAGRHSALLEDETLSRITDAEMKAIMVAACRKVEALLRLRASDPAEYARQVRDVNERYCRGWER